MEASRIFVDRLVANGGHATLVGLADMTHDRTALAMGDADSAVKRKVFGQNTARLYKYDIKSASEGISRDQIAVMKQEYKKEGVLRNNAFYGYVPKTA